MRMEHLKQQGYEPVIESPKVIIQEPPPALPLRSTYTSNNRKPHPSLPAKPPKVTPGETVVSVEATGKKMDIVYEFGMEEVITHSPNDAYEKNVVETILDIS